jgi:hypothetical protein
MVELTELEKHAVEIGLEVADVRILEPELQRFFRQECAALGVPEHAVDALIERLKATKAH